MQVNRMSACGLAALVFSVVLSHGADAQYRDRSMEPQATPGDTDSQIDRGRPSRGARPDGRKDQREMSPPRTRAQPQAQRRQAAPQDDRGQKAQPRDQRRRAAPERDRTRQARPQRRPYDRRAERRWNKDRPSTRRPVYIPHRWDHRDRPHHRHLWDRRYGRVWWCGTGCRIVLLFGFTVWAVDTVVSYESAYSFPIWEALEYNQTGETSLWESDWGYVEFTPTRTFRRRFGRVMRDCRDFLRVVVRDDGFERRFRGTACRNPQGAWWIVSSREVAS